MDNERLISLKEFESLLGYEFNEIELLNQAFTHKSYANEVGLLRERSNEVLEFLGDAVLNLAVTHLLVKEFPEAKEGDLSLWRSQFVKRSSLAILSRRLHLDRYLLLGKSELQNGGTKKSSILANAYEALIGAIYIDSNFDRISQIIWNHMRSFFLNERSISIFNDYKSILQKHVQRVNKVSPKYEVLREIGPNHDKIFEVSVSVAGEIMGIGCGKSKKEAQQEAARQALNNLGYDSQES